MLQQQLQQRDEDLVARKAEISELKERVAALEKLEQQQAQLLTMKDSELAAAQQRLADARKTAAVAAAQPAAVAATQTTQQTQPAQEPAPQASNVLPWLWGSLAVVGLGLLAWVLSRRRSSPPTSSTSKPRRSFDSEALAASMRSPAVAVEPESGTVLADAAVATTFVGDDVQQVIDVAELPTTSAAQIETPTWHSGRWVNADVQAGTAESTTNEPRFVPSDDELPAEPLPEPASAEQRMKLARAFLDIGDDHSAKQLLVELMDGEDPAMRTDAAKLLRELG